ncbi:MAG: DUF192 domain-containing protein [Thermoplasmatota archaeon]
MVRGYAFILLILAPLIVAGCLDGGDENGESKEGLAQVIFFTDDQQVLKVDCEIADTQEERAKGLMDREELPADMGMLFYYEVPRVVSFWMKNTSIPLDIIFVSPEFTVLNIAEAEPGIGISDNEQERYPSDGEVRYVIEINQGLAEKHNIIPGSTVTVWEY